MEPLSQQEEKYFLKALKFLQLQHRGKAAGQPWPENSSQSRSMGEYQKQTGRKRRRRRRKEMKQLR